MELASRWPGGGGGVLFIEQTGQGPIRFDIGEGAPIKPGSRWWAEPCGWGRAPCWRLFYDLSVVLFSASAQLIKYKAPFDLASPFAPKTPSASEKQQNVCCECHRNRSSATTGSTSPGFRISLWESETSKVPAKINASSRVSRMIGGRPSSNKLWGNFHQLIHYPILVKISQPLTRINFIETVSNAVRFT